MWKRAMTLLLGNTIASLGITCVIKAGLGVFPGTAANIAISNWLGISIGMASMLVETLMLAIATYKGEGIGITAIVNATYGSLMIDVFNAILPSHPIMVVGLVLLPLGWSFMGRAALADTGSNVLTNALVKQTGKSISTIRNMIETSFLVIGLLGARNQITILTFILSFGFGYLMSFIYKLVHYNPTEIKHKFIIKRKIKSA